MRQTPASSRETASATNDAVGRAPRPTVNADVGESIGIHSFGNDRELLELVDLVNVAGGLHAGDPSGIAETVEAAVARGVAVGAHPGLPDVAGFGRRAMAISPREARDLVRYQVGAVEAFVRRAGAELSHIKPHGALFGMLARDDEMMDAVCDVALQFGVPVLGLAGTAHERAAERNGVGFVSEFYVDLDYDDDGMVVVNRVGRQRDLAEVKSRALTALSSGRTLSTSGAELSVRAESFCVHSDLPNAVDVARTIRGLLEA